MPALHERKQRHWVGEEVNVSRLNPRVEHLEREVAMLRREMEIMRKDPGDVPFGACDNSCVCATATGMATNGGCHCDANKLRRAVMYWRRVAQFRQITIQDLRGDDVLPDLVRALDDALILAAEGKMPGLTFLEDWTAILRKARRETTAPIDDIQSTEYVPPPGLKELPMPANAPKPVAVWGRPVDPRKKEPPL